MSSAPHFHAAPAGHAANENAGPAPTQRLAPHAQATARCDPYLATIFCVRNGVIAFMVNGAADIVMTGGTVEIPRDVTHACRNIGDTPAVLACRRCPAGLPSGRGRR